ncbi:MAG TPA: hypothetical protein VMB78_05285, partial [Dissulfurispiraceae bacterium]|nr:hypothetical protein [Dissulfurispiraceae bacterium]
MNMHIADINFALRCMRPISVHEPDAAYRQFMESGQRTSAAEVTLDIELNGLPGIPGMPVVFDGQSWSLSSDGKNYFFSSQSPASAVPFWAAKIGPGFRNGTIYCSKQAITEK